MTAAPGSSDPGAASAPPPSTAGPPGDDRRFSVATRVRPGPVAHRYEAAVSPHWTVRGRPNGGYLLAIAARAAAAVVGAHPDPVAATATYLQSPSTGPVTLRTEVLRRGRSASQARVVVEQEGLSCVDATFVLGKLDPAAEPRSGRARPPRTSRRPETVPACRLEHPEPSTA